MTQLILTDSAFGEAHRTLLRCLAELMIPAEGDLPSAADPAILAAILDRLGERADMVNQGLALIASHGAQTDFPTLAPTEQQAIIARVRTEQPEFVSLFETAVVACYYRDDRVLRSLGLPDRAPYPEGNAVEPTDWSLLSPVREREPFFRSV